ncbi:GIY-YIG nuclease family protein [Mucilaginibacter sp. R11]|uniref:GIY-YIG nuclease family protein n=2 Tax=Mucilaginibacter agri TaxID=2695265 RepID=A0A965ZDF8_9SPHI|nr:GIY-YIG nuclease family protein [Mucilaginibacter agri]
MYHIYILHSAILDRYYIGSTQNVAERLRRHLSNHKGFTARASDWELVYQENLPNWESALMREKQIKGWKSKLMIQKLVSQRA